MPYILFDIAILAILALFLWRGAKKGLVLSLCGLIAVIVAFVGAGLLADALAPRVAESLAPRFTAVIQEQMDSVLGSTYSPDLTDPSIIDQLLEVMNNAGFYSDFMKDALDSGATGPQFAKAVGDAIAQSVAYAVLFLVGFVVLLILWTLLSHALDLVTKLPGLNFLNKTGGALLGLVKGAILLFVAAWALRFSNGLIPQEAIEQTWLLKFFMTTNPVTLLTGV